MFHHTGTHGQCMCSNVISHALHHVHTYPAATQKGLSNLCLCQLQCMRNPRAYHGIKIFLLHTAIAIDMYKAACMHSKLDDKMNTLAFINFLLVKNFPTLICYNFTLSKFCAIR